MLYLTISKIDTPSHAVETPVVCCNTQHRWFVPQYYHPSDKVESWSSWAALTSWDLQQETQAAALVNSVIAVAFPGAGLCLYK